MPAIDKLRKLCQSWGGHLVLLDDEQWYQKFDDREFTKAPASNGHGINWSSKIIYARIGFEHPGAIIHEMGHVFADHREPNRSDEFSWLGWEIVTAKLVGCYREWSDQNSNYQIGDVEGIDGYDWGLITARAKSRVARDRIEEGQNLGIIDRHERPLAIR